MSTPPPDPHYRLVRAGRLLERAALLSILSTIVAAAVPGVWGWAARPAVAALLLMVGAWMVVGQGLVPVKTGHFRLWLVPSLSNVELPKSVAGMFAATNIAIGSVCFAAGVLVALSAPG